MTHIGRTIILRFFCPVCLIFAIIAILLTILLICLWIQERANRKDRLKEQEQ